MTDQPQDNAGANPDAGAPPPEPTTVDGGSTSPEGGDSFSWPDTWREVMAKDAAGDDKKAYDKELKRLQRYQNPNAVYKSNRALESKLSGGEYKPVLRDGATAEEVAEYRKAHGIPERPEDYKIELSGGRIIGEDIKSLTDSFVAKMHEANVPPAVVNKALEWYFDNETNQNQLVGEFDAEKKAEAEDALRNAWGNEYRQNQTINTNFLQGAPEVIQNMAESRHPDGRKLGDIPEFATWINQLAREAGMAPSIVPGTSANNMESLQSEIDKYKAQMGDPKSDYRTNPKAQERYRELVAALEKQQRRSS